MNLLEWFCWFAANINTWAAWATTLSLPIGAAALWYAAHQTKLSRRANAASVALAASEAFRDGWSTFRSAASVSDQAATFADLLNLIEACCAIYRDGLLVGRSGKMLDSYLVNTLTQIELSAGARALFEELVETDKTFEEIGWFLRNKRRHRADFLSRLHAYEAKR